MNKLAPSLSLLALALGAGIAAQDQAAAPTAVPLDSSFNEVLNWRNVGPAAAGGRILKFEVLESDPKVFYVQSASGGLWKTTNAGHTFRGLFQHENTISIGDVQLSQSNPDVLYVGTGEHNPRNSVSWGDGVYKSVDGGETWNHLGLENSFQIGRMAIHPTNPDILYVGALGRLWGPNEERGVFKTTDGGQTWEHVLYISEDTGIIELQMDPSDPDSLLAAAYQRRRGGFDDGEPMISSGPEGGIYKTTDGGRNWRRLSEGLPQGDMGRTGIDYYMSDPRIVYLQTGGSRVRDGSNGVYRSEDGGESWAKVNDLSNRPMYYSQIRVDPSDDQKVYTLATSSNYSVDGGQTFERFGRGIHEDSHELWIDPMDGAHMRLGNDGGLFETYDYGNTFDFIGNLPIAQSYHVGVSPERLYWVYTGLQDNGNWGAPSAMRPRGRNSNGPGNDDWLFISGADGFVCLVDPNDANTLYYETQGASMRRLNLATGETVSIRPQAQGQTWNWEGPMHLSPHNSHIFFTAGKSVFRSFNRGEDARAISEDLSITEKGAGSAVAQSPLDPDVIYAGYTDGAMYVTRDGGARWTRIDENVGLPGTRWVDSIEPSRYEAGRVYVAFDGHRSNDDAPHAYVSEDYGETWQSMNGTLPPIGSTRALREDIENPNLLYCGTEFAMFASVDRGQNWVKINSNLPTVAVHEVAIHPIAGEIAIATHGRGVWILDVAPLRQMTEDLAAGAHLFEPRETILWGRGGVGKSDLYGGDRWYGDNHETGAILYYYTPNGAGEVSLTVSDSSGALLRSLPLGDDAGSPGLHRLVWDLSRDTPRQARGAAAQRGGRGQGGRGQRGQGQRGQRGQGRRGGGRGRGGRGGGGRSRVGAGTYRLTLTVDGQQITQNLVVSPDPQGR